MYYKVPESMMGEFIVTNQVPEEKLPIIEEISRGIGGLVVEFITDVKPGDLFDSASMRAGQRTEDSRMTTLEEGNVVVRYRETKSQKISELHYRLNNYERRQASAEAPSAHTWGHKPVNTYGDTKRAKKPLTRTGWL